MNSVLKETWPREPDNHRSSGWLLERVRRNFPDSWGLGTFIVAILLFIPLGLVLVHLAKAGPEWNHLASTVLAKYVGNTVWLVLSVAAVTALIGVPTAWLVTHYDFVGRRFFSWALVLPLAIPTYVSAFVFYELVEKAIPFRIWIRGQFGIDAFLASEPVIRLGLLVLSLSMVLFPYVFLSCRAAFSSQGTRLFESGRCLGKNSRQVFFSVALPLARPALVAGLALVVMEVINDYGAVHHFGVPTLTEGIFRTWIGLEDKQSALRLAALGMVVIVGVIALERLLRGAARFFCDDAGKARGSARPLNGGRAFLAFAVCLVPFVIGFAYPIWILGNWAFLSLSGQRSTPGLGPEVLTGSITAVITAVIVTALAVVFAYSLQLRRNPLRSGLGHLSMLGYATPGIVVALGIMAVLGAVDRTGGLLPQLSGTIFAVGFAYAVRYFAVPLQFTSAGLRGLGLSLGEASRTLGSGPWRTLFRVYLPLLRGTAVAATMLLLIDILKELPLTLVLRPVNFETLATAAFSHAKEGRLEACAVPSLLIVLCSGIGVAWLNRWFHRDDK